MRYAERDGVKLYFDDTGEGPPIIFLHEYGGDHRSWEPQVRYFSRWHRCIVTAARGYPPSDVPDDAALYGQGHAINDAVAVLDHLGLDKVIVIGLSMGGYTALRLALQMPKRITAIVAASAGSGSYPAHREAFQREAEKLAAEILRQGRMLADDFAMGPTRTQLKRKDPRGWVEFRDHLAEHPAVGAAHTLSNVQAKRPSLYDFEDQLSACRVPTLLMVGDEDEACLDANVWLKRTMPIAGLDIAPKSGHLLNLEDPARFNGTILSFLHTVRADAWDVRATPSGSFGGVGPASDV